MKSILLTVAFGLPFYLVLLGLAPKEMSNWYRPVFAFTASLIACAWLKVMAI